MLGGQLCITKSGNYKGLGPLFQEQEAEAKYAFFMSHLSLQSFRK